MAGFAYYVIQRNYNINDSIFHTSNGMQRAYSKMLGVARILFLVYCMFVSMYHVIEAKESHVRILDSDPDRAAVSHLQGYS